MKFCQALLRVIFPAAEKERMAFRESIARVAAHAEDLKRTLESEPVAEALKTGVFHAKGKLA